MICNALSRPNVHVIAESSHFFIRDVCIKKNKNKKKTKVKALLINVTTVKEWFMNIN